MTKRREDVRRLVWIPSSYRAEAGRQNLSSELIRWQMKDYLVENKLAVLQLPSVHSIYRWRNAKSGGPGDVPDIRAALCHVLKVEPEELWK